jgi:hypothetical protein
VQLRLHAEVQGDLQVVYFVACVRRYGIWFRIGAAMLDLYDAARNEEAFHGDMAVALARVRQYARVSRGKGHVYGLIRNVLD